MSDYSDTLALQKRFMEATKKLQEMDASYAMARTIKSYDSDRRKKLLAESVVQAFKDGAESASEAEHRARASAAYGSGLVKLQAELKAAEEIIVEVEMEDKAWETCRSLLAMQREGMKRIPE